MRTYTIPELKRRSTEQIFAIFERLTGQNPYELWFNPFEERYSVIQRILAIQERTGEHAVSGAPEPLSESAWRRVWNTLWARIRWALKIEINGNPVLDSAPHGRKRSEAVIRLIRSLFADGESPAQIAQWLGIPRNRAYRICRGDVYAAVN